MPIGMNEKRSWQPREMQMLSEYIAKNLSDKRVLTRVRLGTPRSEVPDRTMTAEELAMMGSWRRWADGVILDKDRVTIIECAIRPDPGKISQLELYKMLFPNTPEFMAFWNKPIDLMLIYAIEDPATIFLARQKGIRCIEYKPPWLSSYLDLLMPRERRGTQFTTS